MMKAFDTHIHLDLLDDPDVQLDEAGKAGVAGWIVPGVEPGGWSRILAITERYASVYAAPGIHPQSAGSLRAEDLGRLRELMSNAKVVAIGEVGLDARVDVPLQSQEELFIQMIRLAREARKPLLIHARKSSGRILELLQQEKAAQVGGLFHAFSGSLEMARRIIDLGFLLGIGGVVTWPTAKRLPEVVRAVPADALVLETDAPFLAPASFGGQPNRAASLVLVAEQVAALRGLSLEETVRVTTENARRIFKLQDL